MACSVTINGEVTELVAGDNEISVTFTLTDTGVGDGSGISSFDLQMGYYVDGTNDVAVDAATITITGVKWTEATSSTDSSTASTVTYAVNYSDTALQGYVLTASTTYYFAANGSISTTKTDGIISYANYTSDKTVSVIKDSDENSITATVDEVGYTYALNTGGKTTSSRAYYEIDLSSYVGKTVTIYAIFTSNSTADRSAMITTAKSDSTTATTVLETATSSSQTDVQTVSYSVTVSTTTTYYICASASINFYYVGVTVAGS